MSRRRGIAIGIMSAALAVGFAIAMLITHRFTKGTPAAPISSDCMVKPESFLSSADLPRDFMQFLRDTSMGNPFHGHAGPGGTTGQPVFVSNFRRIAVQGYIIRAVVDGPYRAENDAFARSLHYDIGRMPLVPLTGKVVEEVPGPLEIYQANYWFASAEGAQSWLTAQQHRVQVIDGPPITPIELRLGDAAVGNIRAAKDSRQERQIGFDVRIGPAVMSLSYQGGAAITQVEAERLAARAVAHLEKACGITASTGG